MLLLHKDFYAFAQNRYFSYRNSKTDTFLFILAVLLSYLIFLDYPPSLLRAFGMLIVGFILYDRGMKIISIQTLFLTVVLLLAFFPRLVFTLGFWLSVSGVFYIFLFLIHFKNLNKVLQFILIPFWVYVLMLPFSLTIFGNFSIYHLISILWTTLFTIFYPLSIFIHVIGFANLFDGVLESLISLGQEGIAIEFSIKILAIHVTLSLMAIFKRVFVYLMLIFNLSLFIYTIYHVTQF